MEKEQFDLGTSIIRDTTEKLLKDTQALLTKAYFLESLRSEIDDEHDGAARMITSIKTVRGILRERLKDGK